MRLVTSILRNVGLANLEYMKSAIITKVSSFLVVSFFVQRKEYYQWHLSFFPWPPFYLHSLATRFRLEEHSLLRVSHTINPSNL